MRAMRFSGALLALMLRALAVTTSRRSPAAPDLPTVAESGLKVSTSLRGTGPWCRRYAPAVVALIQAKIAAIVT